MIRQIYRQLKARGINPWLDEEEIALGTKFQDEIQQAIGQVRSTAIYIGLSVQKEIYVQCGATPANRQGLSIRATICGLYQR